MWSAFYQALLWLSYPVVRLRLYWRARRSPAYGLRVQERFGWVPAQVSAGALWIHCVSAGETIAAAPLIKRLLVALQRSAERSGTQPMPILVTTMTPTGSEQVQRLLGDTVMHCYAPYDFRFAVRRFLDSTEPSALVIVETEIWPNLVTLSKARDMPVMLVNARLSARSARGYGRVAGLMQSVLERIDWIACQYPADRERFAALGANPNSLSCVGNMKFDTEQFVEDGSSRPALELIDERLRDPRSLCWLAGSTHAGEESVVLAAHAGLLARFPELCLMLVPRHPERFDSVHDACADLPTIRLSHWLAGEVTHSDVLGARIILVDCMGLLGALYSRCDVAFIGGSLVPVGGHNPIEAAAVGVPMIMGPQRFNFATVCEAFTASGSLLEVADVASMIEALTDLLSLPQQRAAMGQAAQSVVRANAGSTQLLLDGISVRVGTQGVDSR